MQATITAAFKFAIDDLAAILDPLNFLPSSGSLPAAFSQARKQILYLSGPEPAESIGSKLQERGITVKQDRFTGYDDNNY